MTRIHWPVVGALLAVLAAVLVFTPAASADAARPGGAVSVQAGPRALSDCPDNDMCAWADANFGGKHIEMAEGCSNFYSCFKSNFNDVVSSLANHTSYEWCFSTLPEYLGRAYPITAGAEVGYVGNTWNDEFESAHVLDIGHWC